ncbi:AsmA family protein [Dyella psychrodurans]|uniref:AsmA family protein n=1 Tax=Dyella psychrodurans TaxID=1927960 RepID=A0A370XEL2_9GAMM|nr:AsmA family protein [Dyella psychrodurans]RDS86727.1 AsmA family protein [Dyella psychrodurans]
MKRIYKLLAWIAGLLLVLLVALILVVALFDWNRLKPVIDDNVSAAIGHPFVIQGDLTVAWQREPAQQGLSAWVPWPTFTARSIQIANPSWTKQPQFAQLDALQFRFSPLGLLVHHIDVPSVQLVGPQIDLERDTHGQANWLFTLPQTTTPSAWQLNLGAIGFDQGHVALDDAQNRLKLQVTITPLQQAIPYDQIVAQATDEARADVGHGVGKTAESNKTQPDMSAGAARTNYQFAWTADGSYQGTPVTGTGKSGAMLALQQTDQPFPVQARMHIGDSKIALVGTLTDPVHLGALDLRVWFAGTSMAKLYPITGITLPDTPPYGTEGHLVAELHPHGSRFDYRDFRGRVGQSDLGGHVQLVTGGDRPKLSGDIHSQQLRFVDLAPLIGADSKAEKQQRGDTTQQPADKVLPVETFRTDRLRTMDADVTFSAARIEHPTSTPIDSLSARVWLDNSVLQIDPLHMGVAGGTIDGMLRVDGGAQPMRGALQLNARHLQLKQLFPTFGPMSSSFGEINGDVALNAHGNSVAALMGDANGDVKLLMNDGAISKTLLETAGLNVANVVVEKMFGDKTVKINCAAADLGGSDGLFNSKLFVFDTDDATVNVDGTVNFANEHMDLNITPHTKGFRVFSLRSPLYVKGTFKNPDVGVHAGPLLLRGGGAVALGVLAPPAALLALVAPSHSDHANTCQQVLSSLRDVPPPRSIKR